MYFKQQAYWCLQRYMGWSQPDSSGFLSKASLYVASEQQLQAVLRTKNTGKVRDKEKEKEKEKENLLHVHYLCIHVPSKVHKVLESEPF